MEIQQVDLGGPLDDVYSAYHAATADRPGPAMDRILYTFLLRHGGTADRAEAWVAVADGRIVGGHGLHFPLRDNTHMGVVFEGFVDPGHRRRGIGSALFAHARARVRAVGRRLLVGETEATGSGAAFVAAHGCEIALPEARRVLDLRTADWAALKDMRPQVEGYHLETFTGAAPEELMADLAALMGGMNDAPRGGDIGEMLFDADRMREFEARIEPSGGLSYAMIARRSADGAPAGYTRIYLEADRATTWAKQADTVVLAEHRGHRLGLLLKVANLLWLHESEPHIERIITWNATSNTHMLAINEAMGFELLDEWNTWQITA